MESRPARQLALFELKEDCRPAAERTAAGRYREPTFWAARRADPAATPDIAPRNPYWTHRFSVAVDVCLDPTTT